MKTDSREFNDTRILGIDHIAIAVPNLEAAISWYTKCLGFDLIERRTTTGDHTSMLSAVVGSGPVAIVLLQGVEANSQVSRFISEYGPGVQHIALSVENLPYAKEKAVTAGAKMDTPTISGQGIRQIFMRRDDASGVRVELIERSGGTFTDDTVKQLFLSFEQQHLW